LQINSFKKRGASKNRKIAINFIFMDFLLVDIFELTVLKKGEHQKTAKLQLILFLWVSFS